MRRDQENRTSNSGSKGYHTILRRLIRNSLSTSERERKFRSTRNLHSNDGRTGADQFSISVAWLSYRITTIIASAITTGFGVAHLYMKLIGMG